METHNLKVAHMTNHLNKSCNLLKINLLLYGAIKSDCYKTYFVDMLYIILNSCHDISGENTTRYFLLQAATNSLCRIALITLLI